MISWKLCFVIFATACLQCAANPLSAEELTPAAQKVLSEIVGMINNKIDPCNDFHGYVCSKVETNPFSETRKSVHQKTMDLFMRHSQPTDGTAIKQYYKFYQDCQAAKAHQSHRKYGHTLDFLFHMMPSNRWVKNIENNITMVRPRILADMAAHAFVYDYNIFMPIAMVNPVRNAEFIKEHDKILSVQKPILLKSLRYYDSKNLHLYEKRYFKNYSTAVKEQMSTVLYLSGDDDENFSFDIIELEKKIAEVLRSNQEEEINEMTVGKAMEQMPQFNWTYFILTLEELSGANLTQHCKLKDCPIQFASPNATAEYLKIISNMEERDYVTYALTRIAMEVNRDPLRTEDDTINCELLTQKTFPLVKQYLYITETYPMAKKREELKSSGIKLVDNIIASVRNTIDKVPWIKNEPETYNGFTEKLEKLRKVIAYPDHLLNQTWLDKQYIDFDPVCHKRCSNAQFTQYRTARKYITKKYFEARINNTIDYTDPKAIFVSPTINKIFVPISALYQNIYHPDNSPAVNYDGLGFVIAQEIFHGLYSKGKQHDAGGHLQKWMSAHSENSFHSMTKCLIDEYNRFELTNVDNMAYNVNGRLTVEENIADLGGILAAYNAFRDDPASKVGIAMRDMKDLTDEQLFFVSFARLLCNEDARLSLFEALDRKQVPSSVRVYGVLRNFVPFREAFKCPVNSAYAPEKHCEVFTSTVE